MTRRTLLCALAMPAWASPLVLRSRVEPFKGSGEWREVKVDVDFQPKQAALILCDMWDKHWCGGATGRVEMLAPRMAPLLTQARAAGMLIIHAPSETMGFYKDAPQRQAMLRLTTVEPPAARVLPDVPLPIDDAGGGCDTTADKFYRAWSRQHPAIAVGPNDLISDNGKEVYSALQLRGVKTLFVAGVHTNMCILNRTFAIKQMTRWGVRCVLVRDLTDAMYNPADRPFVTHDQGTQLVIEHIEKHWAPSVTSTQLLAALR